MYRIAVHGEPIFDVKTSYVARDTEVKGREERVAESVEEKETESVEEKETEAVEEKEIEPVVEKEVL